VSPLDPVRVLHTIDGLAGGGSERWVWDLVRLAEPGSIAPRVVPIHFDRGTFVYADRLRALDALGSGRGRASDRDLPVASGPNPPLLPRSEARPRRGMLDRVPRPLRSWAIRGWHGAVVFPVAAARLLAEFLRFRPDVLHAHTFHALVAGLVLRTVSRRPLVYTVPSSFAHIRQSGYAWAPGMYARHQRRIDRFVTSYPGDLRRIGVPDSRILFVPGMADVAGMAAILSRREEHRGRIRSELGIAADARLAISVGRLAPEKGLACGMQALPRVLGAQPDFHWGILGHGPDHAALGQLARGLGIERHVHLVGFVSDPLPWYAAADLYLRTNVVEGDNLSSFQAMAAALPVVGFDTGSETELVLEAGHGVLVENRNPQALAAAICELLAAPDRQERGLRGAAYAEAHLSTERIVRSVEEVYRELGRPAALLR
jgi:glycosyltransferase involved in cell wall biosynthesis